MRPSAVSPNFGVSSSLGLAFIALSSHGHLPADNRMCNAILNCGDQVTIHSLVGVVTCGLLVQ